MPGITLFCAGVVVSLAASWLLVSRLERLGERAGFSEAWLGLIAALAADAKAAHEAAAAARRSGGADSVVMTIVRACESVGDQRAAEVQRAGDHSDRRRRRPTVPQPGPPQSLGLRPYRPVALRRA